MGRLPEIWPVAPQWRTAEDRQQGGNPARVRWEAPVGVSAGGTGQMATTNPIDEYLAALDEPKRTT
jgi:hypothetical protein